MSATNKLNNIDDQQNVGDSDSSLNFLQDHNQQPADDPQSNLQPKKKQKDEEARKAYIANRARQKKLQSDAYDGTYLYKPGVELPSLYQFANQSIKIIVAAQYIKRQNPQLLKRNLYGTDPYTSNSDAVCILVHSGYINLNSFQNRKCEGVELTCKVIKPKKNYTGGFKNGVMSRSLKGYNGNALKPQSVRVLPSLGPMELLQRYAANMHIPIGKNRIKAKPKNISSIIPIPQTHLVFNMNDEPAYKYSIFNIADKGFQKNEFMIKKLDNYVLYLQTEDGDKYELVKKIQMEIFDIFRFGRVKSPQKLDNDYFAENKCPVQEDMLEIIYPTLEWDQIKWGNSSVLLKNDKRIEGITSFKYYKKK